MLFSFIFWMAIIFSSSLVAMKGIQKLIFLTNIFHQLNKCLSPNLRRADYLLPPYVSAACMIHYLVLAISWTRWLPINRVAKHTIESCERPWNSSHSQWLTTFLVYLLRDNIIACLIILEMLVAICKPTENVFIISFATFHCKKSQIN